MNTNDTNNVNLSLNHTQVPDDFTSCEIFYFVVSGLIGILTILVGLFGNSLAFFVLNSTQRKSVTFFILKTLAVVDTLFLVTYGLVTVSARILDSLSIPGTYGTFQYVIYLVFPLMSMSLTLTLWLTCLLTIHRYIGICKAFNASRWSNMRTVKIHVASMIVVSALLEVVRYIDYQIQEHQYNDKTYILQLPTKLYENEWYQLLYRNILMTGLRSILPIVITIILTTYLVKTVIQLSKQKVKFVPSTQWDIQSNTADKEAGVTRTLILIATLMVVLNTPIAIYPVLMLTLDINPNPCSHFYHYFATTAEAMAALNSALNFYIYYPTMPTLRTELTKMRDNLKYWCAKSDNKVYITAKKVSVKVIDIVKETNDKQEQELCIGLNHE